MRPARSSSTVAACTAALAVEHHGALDLGRDLGQVERAHRGRRHRRSDANTDPYCCRRCPQPLAKFFADRGPHLAAMIAYFALLSFVPLLFLTISRRSRSPGGRTSRATCVTGAEARTSRAARSRASSTRCARSRTTRPPSGSSARLGLLWTSLSLFSVLESAFNIVYGQPNRSFLRGKLLAVGADAGLAGNALLRAAGRVVRVRPAQALCGRGRGQLVCRVQPLGRASRRSRCSSSYLAVYYLLTNVEHTFTRRAPGRGRGGRGAGGELPGAAASTSRYSNNVRRAEGLRRAGPAARLAVRDGERDRLRRRGELALRREAPPADRRRAEAAGLA